MCVVCTKGDVVSAFKAIWVREINARIVYKERGKKKTGA